MLKDNLYDGCKIINNLSIIDDGDKDTLYSNETPRNN